jgi:hypothetical protein
MWLRTVSGRLGAIATIELLIDGLKAKNPSAFAKRPESNMHPVVDPYGVPSALLNGIYRFRQGSRVESIR